MSALRLNLMRSDDLGAKLRELVEAGEPDGPAEVAYDGGPVSLFVRSIHYSALRSISEEPSVRFVDWAPHPKFGKPPGPRVQALLDARDARRAEARRKTEARRKSA